MKRVQSGGAVAAAGRGTGEQLHSLVLATDYHVKDVERMWSLIKDGRSPLAGLGAHHVVLYRSISEPGRVLVTLGIRHRTSVQELLRSPAVFDWFDLVGVNDLPAIFAGAVLEKIDLVGGAADSVPAAVIVGAVCTVDDVAELLATVHAGLDRFAAAGVRKVWLYRAFDNGREVMTLLEIDSLHSAQRWIDRPDVAAQWMSPSSSGIYPSLFVGKLAHVMSTEASR